MPAPFAFVEMLLEISHNLESCAVLAGFTRRRLRRGSWSSGANFVWKLHLPRPGVPNRIAHTVPSRPFSSFPLTRGNCTSPYMVTFFPPEFGAGVAVAGRTEGRVSSAH